MLYFVICCSVVVVVLANCGCFRIPDSGFSPDSGQPRSQGPLLPFPTKREREALAESVQVASEQKN